MLRRDAVKLKFGFPRQTCAYYVPRGYGVSKTYI
jgi:hypothetical protein